MTDDEWKLRVDLAACYRLVAHYGWDDLIFTHISARLPGPDHHFLINPYGMMFDEITASSLVKIDLEGKKVDRRARTRSTPPASRSTARSTRGARTRSACSTRTASTASRSRRPRTACCPCRSSRSSCSSSLGYHDYEGVALNEDEKPRLVRDLGDKSFFMLRNHGLLTVGGTIADAFVQMYLFEAACTIQLRAQAASAELVPIDPRIIAGAQAMAKQVTRSAGGGLAWPGLLRKLDRLDASYKS